MMRVYVAFVIVMLCAFALRAEPVPYQDVTLSAVTGTNTTATSQALTKYGYVDTVTLELPTGASTGTVVLVASPVVGADVVLATNQITATTLIRPRFDATDSAGAALTNDPPQRYLCVGDTLQATVTDANVTGKTWRVYVKFDR